MSQFMGADTRVSNRARNTDQIAAALRGGQILVNSEGKVVWIDEVTRRRLNGELEHLDLSEVISGPETLDCLMAPAELTIRGQQVTVCVIRHKSADESENRDLLAAVEAVMADSATWFTRTILERIKSLRLGSTAKTASDLDILSERELQVLGLICEGRTDTQMSEAMGLSHNTVRNHIASLYRKIGVNRRSAALIWARERGVTGCTELPKKLRRHRYAGRSVTQSNGASY
jgi:DNA-binding CsgD family transcriptional regulator